MHPQLAELARTCVEERVGHVVLAGGLPPAECLQVLREGGSRAIGFAPALSIARKLRRSLEAFHGKVDAKAVDFVWPHLNSDDRALRYAARIALEWQPVAQWKDRAIAEKGVNGGITALLALARADILRYVEARGLPFVDDESNADRSLRRNFLRHEIGEALARGYGQLMPRPNFRFERAVLKREPLAVAHRLGAGGPVGGR